MAVAPFPFETLPRISLADLAVGNSAVTWLGQMARAESRPEGPLRALGLEVTGARLVGVSGRSNDGASNDAIDSSTGLVWVGREGARALVSLPGSLVRSVAGRLLAGPKELAAPRPLTAAEHALAAMLCASALAGLCVEDGGAGSAAWSVEPWQPFPEVRSALAATEKRLTGWPRLEVIVALDGREHPLRVWTPPSLVHRRPRSAAPPSWLARLRIELPLVVAAAPMEPAVLARLQVRDVIVVEAPAGGAELRVSRGAVGLRVRPGASHAVIESSYRRRVKSPSEGPAAAVPPFSSGGAADAQPDASVDASVDALADALVDDVTAELTVTLGSVALSLRQLTELAVGQVVSLGRPLHGPFELRIAGKPMGRGELVDVEGSLGVRIVSLQA
jgi:flagellar motor switch/type III secretory pathway protein FliN